MARGWESKSVDDQIAQAEDARSRREAVDMSAAVKERETKRTALRMSRARVLEQLQTACNANHRATLEQSLAFIDAELRAIEAS
jgi:hypothetical protein